jgi:hypothetical protein
MPPFDPMRAAFYLLVAIIGTELVLVSAGVLTCIWYAASRGEQLAACKDAKFAEILANALAVALALMGIRAARPHDKE